MRLKQLREMVSRLDNMPEDTKVSVLEWNESKGTKSKYSIVCLDKNYVGEIVLQINEEYCIDYDGV